MTPLPVAQRRYPFSEQVEYQMKTTNRKSALVLGIAMSVFTSGAQAAYKASKEEKPIKIVNLLLLEEQVRPRMEKGLLDIFAAAPRMKATFAATPQASTRSISCPVFFRASSLLIST